MKDEIKEILDKLEIVARKHTIEVREDGSKIETMPACLVDELRLNNYSAKLLLDYITNLQEKLQQKENIIKEVREYIENHSITNIEWWITGKQKIECKFMKNANPQELLEILDKPISKKPDNDF